MKKNVLQSVFFILISFLIPTISNAQWLQIGGDIVGDMTYEYYGRAINLGPDGSTVAIGSQANPENSFFSFVRVYKENNGKWEPIGNDIVAASGDNSDAIALSKNGNRIAIGSIRNGVVNGQAVYGGHVRVFDLVDEDWEQIGDEVIGSGGENLGSAIGISSDGTVLVLGAHFNDINGFQAGYVQIYKNENIVGVSDFSDSEISIYPNPSSGQFYIRNAESFNLKITDINGKLLYKTTINDN